jgi:spore germination protein
MNPYDEGVLTERQLMIALPSVIIGIALLSLPGNVASVTAFSDGWITILIAGMIFTVLTYLSGKLAASFPRETFLSYATFLVSRPVAICLTFLIGVMAILIVAYVVRMLAFVIQQYLYIRTPMEVLALSFLLIVIYAVAGSRVGLFRLNLLFLPIILFIFVFVVVFNIQYIDHESFLPLFKTDLKGYGKGIMHSLLAFSGFEILLFYTSFLSKPKKLMRVAVVGVGLPTLFYIMIFLTSIGVFGHAATSNLDYTTFELAKRATVPGGVLERVDSIVFTIWVMAIFNTAAIFYDVAVLQFQTLFPSKKIFFILLFAPIIFYIAMFPQNLVQVDLFSTWLGYLSVGFISTIILVLFIISRFRRREKDDVQN